MSTPAIPLPAEDATARPGWLVRDLGYLLLGLPLGIAAFVVSVAGFAAGVGTLVVWLGVPLLAGTLAAARGCPRSRRGSATCSRSWPRAGRTARSAAPSW